MPETVPLHLIVFLLATFLGALVAGVAGFVFGLIASAIWLYAITPAQTAALAMDIQGYPIWTLRHALHAARRLPFIAGAAARIPLGAQVVLAGPEALRSPR